MTEPRIIKIAMMDGGEKEKECFATDVPGLVVTQGLHSFWCTITHESSGRILSYRITGKQDDMIELANKMAGPDWTKQWDEIYQDPKSYQDAIWKALEI